MLPTLREAVRLEQALSACRRGHSLLRPTAFHRVLSRDGRFLRAKKGAQESASSRRTLLEALRGKDGGGGGVYEEAITKLAVNTNRTCIHDFRGESDISRIVKKHKLDVRVRSASRAGPKRVYTGTPVLM